MRLRSHRRNLLVWSQSASSVGRSGAPPFTRIRRIRKWIRTGALLTIVFARYVPAALWMLPGIWQVVFSLGVFSSCRFLSRPMPVAGAWYLLTGLICISLADNRALSPWAMGVPYGAGQMLVAAILLFGPREASDEI